MIEYLVMNGSLMIPKWINKLHVHSSHEIGYYVYIGNALKKENLVSVFWKYFFAGEP